MEKHASTSPQCDWLAIGPRGSESYSLLNVASEKFMLYKMNQWLDNSIEK